MALVWSWGRRAGEMADAGTRRSQAGFGPEQGRPGVVIAAEEVRREVVGFADVVEELVEAAVEDEWQALQLFYGQGSLARAGVGQGIGIGQDHRFFRQQGAVEGVLLEGRADDADFDETFAQHVQDAEGVAVIDFKADAPMTVVELAERRPEDDAARRGHGPDGQGAAQAVLEVGDFPARRVGESDDLAGPAVEDFAGIGQSHAARFPLQELHAQFLFQGFHLLAQRRLGHVQATGSRRDLAFFGDDHEVRELTDIHIDASLTYDLRILYQLYKYFQYSKSRVILRP